MKRRIGVLLTLASALLLANGAASALAQDQQWAMLKGQVVWAGAKDPVPKRIDIMQDKAHCEGNGPLFEQDLVVNPKNKGVNWVFVWIAPANGKAADAVGPIHPKFKGVKLKDAVLENPLCMFAPRSVAIQEGQNLLIKNSATILHSIRVTGDPAISPGRSMVIPPHGKLFIKDLQAQRIPLLLECNIHPWMKARLGVFSHPYFAVTDADGNFEIPDAPVGNFKLFVYQESVGWRNGVKGGKGEPIQIKAGVNDLGKLELK